MVKVVRRKLTSLGITLAVIGGAILVFRATNAGDQLIQAARGAGETLGKTITGPVAGLISGAREGGADIAEQAGGAGADIQETFTGNRDAIGDFFNNFFGGSGSNNGDFENVIPEATAELFDFGNILDTLKLGRNETFKFDQPIQVKQTRPGTRLDVTGSRGIVDIPSALGVRGKILPSTAIGRKQPTFQGTLTTNLRPEGRAISGSAALFERLGISLGGR